MEEIIGIILIVIGLYLFTALGIFIVCWSFGLTFTWKMVFGVWVILSLLRINIKIN